MDIKELDQPLVVAKRKDHTEFIANCPISRTGYAITSTIDMDESPDYPFCWACKYNRNRERCAYARMVAGIPDDAELIGYKEDEAKRPIAADFAINGEKFSANLKPGKDMGKSILTLWEEIQPASATFVNLRTGKFVRIVKSPKDQFQKYHGKCYGYLLENEFDHARDTIQIYGVSNPCWMCVWYKKPDGSEGGNAVGTGAEDRRQPETKSPAMRELYDKMIRDKIPEIIERSGKVCVLEQVSGEKRLEYLLKKLLEEGKELQEAKNLYELADVAEVVESIRKELDVSEEELKAAMKDKREKNGGFEKGIVLKEVDTF